MKQNRSFKKIYKKQTVVIEYIESLNFYKFGFQNSNWVWFSNKIPSKLVKKFECKH